MNLIADIGATNSRCALVDSGGQIVRSEVFPNSRFANLEALLLAFTGDASLTRGALAVAGPIDGDEVRLLNIDWHFDRRQLASSLGLESLVVLNDFEALAHALPLLGQDDCRPVGSGHGIPGHAMAVIGPGSGLGVAASVPNGTGFVAVPGEGGHVSLPAFDAAEAGVIREYADANGHCSAERLISGPGLERIHRALARRAEGDAERVPAAEVALRASRGDAIAVAAREMFFAMLGTVAGNLALTVGARGGVFIAGGIVPRMLDAFERSTFRERFVSRGRYREYLEAIPTAVITAENPAFIGLRHLLDQNR